MVLEEELITQQGEIFPHREEGTIFSHHSILDRMPDWVKRQRPVYHLPDGMIFLEIGD